MAPNGLILLILLAMLRGSSAVPPPATFTETLDVTQQQLTGSRYLSFMADLDFAVNRTGDEWIERHPVLRRQTLSTTPAYWIHVELRDAASQRLVTLAIRSDNLYVAGFQNRAGDWYAFRGAEPTLPGSTALSFTGDYGVGGLFGSRGYKALSSVPINRVQAHANALLLANYKSGAAPDAILKPALSFFVLTVAEAERFPTLRAAIGVAIDAQTPQTMKEELVRLVVNWKDLSCALRAWHRSGQRDAAWDATKEAQKVREDIGVLNAKVALTKIQPLLCSASCSWSR